MHYCQKRLERSLSGSWRLLSMLFIVCSFITASSQICALFFIVGINFTVILRKRVLVSNDHEFNSYGMVIYYYEDLQPKTSVHL